MTSRRTLMAVLPPGTEADAAAALVGASAALTGHSGAAFAVVDLRGSGAPLPTAGAQPASPAAWQVQYSPPARFDADAVLALAGAALARIGVEPGTTLVLPAGSGEDVAARLAARLGAQALGRVVGLDLQPDAVLAQRAGWGGRVQMTLRSDAPLTLACWRPARAGVAAVGPAAPLGSLAQPAGNEAATQLQWQPIQVDVPWPEAPQAEALDAADARPALEGARLVVSGGRGMQGEEGFAMLADIADRLGAALGGSLPAVDAGWVPVARQIGQSGKFVGPRTYLAVGISGTPQHLAGVSRETRIVAVNKDAQAPIFGVAEVGVVAEWQELLPALAQELATLRATGDGLQATA